ncbi:MAG: ribonuclease III [Chloroflexi bacterium]|nr:ribonuclease III [Chloroflexota bacterium]
MGDYLEHVKEFAGRNALEFWDWTLLRTALTHRSYLNEHPELDWEDNERLEYLGDAVLDFLLAEYLFHQFPQAPEGELTALRAALVRRETLAQFALEMELGQALFMGHGEVETGGRDRPATLCAGFEALVGAFYLDQGMASVVSLVQPFMARELGAARAEVADKDPKSRLQELAQSAVGVTPRYRTVRAEGPDHAKTFTVEARIGETICGVGEGPSKQIAAQRAAAEALTQAGLWAKPAAPDEEA